MQTKNYLTILALVVIVLAGGAYMLNKGDSSQSAAVAQVPVETPAPAPVAEPTPVTQGEPPVAAPATTKTISTDATYRDPSGEEKVSFTLTIDETGTITAAESSVLATNEIAKMRQTKFAEGFAEAVKGKKLSELASIDRVGGSSLTTNAFKASLAALKAQI